MRAIIATLVTLLLMSAHAAAASTWSVSLTFAPNTTVALDEFEYCYDSCAPEEFEWNHGKLVFTWPEGGTGSLPLDDIDFVTINRLVDVTSHAAKYDATIVLRTGKRIEHASLPLSGLNGKRSGIAYSVRWYAGYNEEQARHLKRLTVQH